METKKQKSIHYEKDVLGKIAVSNDHFWGATTQRSLQYFSIGQEKIPLEFIYAYVVYKKCAAITNYRLKLLSLSKKKQIVQICQKILDHQFDQEFPLHIWQGGSGTHTHMNVNEVIANLCHHFFPKEPNINPHDDVNRSQSTNDSFISSFHIFVALSLHKKLIPSLLYLISVFHQKELEYHSILKLGRTHLQDAVPLTFGQEFSGYVALLKNSLEQIQSSLQYIYPLAAGGMAVGTVLNTDPRFGHWMVQEIKKETHLPFQSASNTFALLSSHNGILAVSNAMNVLATNLLKIANDIRWLGSGPTAGLNELVLPSNESGSSIMPGKVNPTQCEMITMISIQVMANHLAVSIANSQGNFELNVFNPLMLYNMSQSIHLLSDGCKSFADHCIRGLKVNITKVQGYVENALSLATFFNPVIGYDKAAHLVRFALDKHISLRQANEQLHYLSTKEYDSILSHFISFQTK